MNLANERRFAKLKSAKSFHPVQIYLARQIRQTFLLPKSYHDKFAKVSSRQNFLLYGTFKCKIFLIEVSPPILDSP